MTGGGLRNAWDVARYLAPETAGGRVATNARRPQVLERRSGSGSPARRPQVVNVLAFSEKGSPSVWQARNRCSGRRPTLRRHRAWSLASGSAEPSHARLKGGGSQVRGDPANGWLVSLASALQRNAEPSANLTRTQLSRRPAEAPSAAAPRHFERESPGHEVGLVGEAGLEPAASCSQSRCATNCATPRGRCSSVLTWVLAPRVLTGLLTVTP